MFRVVDFPKIKSPFVREDIDGKYVVTPQIAEGFEWVFEDPEVRAVDKLHGTNICVHFKSGMVHAIDNRTTRVMLSPFISLYSPPQTQRMIQGIVNAMEKNIIRDIETASIYGEVIGPKWNGNIHGVDTNYYIPFDYLEEKCHWNSWMQGKYPKTFESISEWFKELPSLFTKKFTGRDELAEGLVFTHPDGRMAKLRRDMFDWYKGDAHQTKPVHK